MKKSMILGAAIALFAVSSLTSCKKDYTCTCTTTDSATSTTTSSSTTINAKKKDAEAACNTSITLFTITTACEIE